MNLEEIVNKYRDDWDIYADAEGFIHVNADAEGAPAGQYEVMLEKWYAAMASIPRPWEGTFHVVIKDGALFERSSIAARKHGLRLLATDVENEYQVLLADMAEDG